MDLKDGLLSNPCVFFIPCDFLAAPCDVIGVVLAAGAGTRLGSLTGVVPKAFLPLAGRMMAARVLDQLAALGITRAVVVVSPRGADFCAALCAESPLPLRFAVQEQPRGMAHALLQAAPWIDAAHFLLTSCDSLQDEAALGRCLAGASDADDAVLMLARLSPEQMTRSSSVALDGDRVRAIIEKPTPGTFLSPFASVSPYRFPREFLALVREVSPSRRGEYELQDAIQALIDRGGRVRGVISPGRRHLTDAADLLSITADLLGRLPIQRPRSEIPPDVALHQPVWIGPNVRFSGAAIIGPLTSLEAGATVGAGVRLHGCVALPKALIPPGIRAERRIFTGDGLFL